MINPMRLTEKGTRSKALLALTLVSITWGTTWLVSKAGVMYMPALQLAGLRQLTGGLIYIVYFISKGKAFPRGRQWIPVIILSILNFLLSNGLTTWGVKYISSGLGAIIGAVFPLWMVVIALIRGNSSLNRKSLIGFVLGFTGICIIFADHLHDFMNANFRFGIFLSITATLTWAFGTIYTKNQADSFNPYFSIGIQMVIAGFMLTSVSHATGNVIPITQIPVISWLSIIYLAVVGSVISFMAYIYALQHLPTEQVSIYAYINPLVAVFLGSWIFDEKLNAFIVFGGLIALCGVYLVNAEFRKNRDQPASQ
ncbi:drug/metabolite-transporting permease [Flavihumibacter solisilvae]|uniref:Drug/metabolite-transporting permease n=2 Tax=Flavihumibacter solisilvae TaxID=1349421 RepID=A0A0C1J092_9BACT|nr:drug/metabolite-transporting permease [Flavihumibacter solisilvae]